MIVRFLKPLSFIPAILLMYMIFSFSAQDATTSSALSYQVSYTIVETADAVFDTELQPSQMSTLATRIEGVVRKLAHMTEYFALAIAISFPLYVYGLHGILLMLVAGLFCVAFAAGDEYHQSFISGRNPAIRDVLIDSFGVFWGIILVRIVGWTGRKTIFRPFTKKKQAKPSAPADNQKDETSCSRQQVSPKKDLGPQASQNISQYGEGYYRQRGVSQHGDGYQRQQGGSPYSGGYQGQQGDSPYSGGYQGQQGGSTYSGGYQRQPGVSTYNSRYQGQPGYSQYSGGYQRQKSNSQSSGAYQAAQNGNGSRHDEAHQVQQQISHEKMSARSSGSDSLSEDMSLKKLFQNLKSGQNDE